MLTPLRSWIAAVVLPLALAGCGGEGRPAPPAMRGANTPIPVDGGERLEWDQAVADGVHLSQYRFAAYVDSKRTELPAATCRSTGAQTAVCSTPLPAMSPGVHVLRFVTYVIPENVESARSAPLQLIVSKRVDAPVTQPPPR